MDAAEHLFVTRGYRTTTMEDIAREAGYSRNAIYRQFASRSELIAAMVQRTTQRYIAATTVPDGSDLIDVLVESLVIVATQFVHDPLLRTIAEHAPDGTVASLIADDTALTELVQATLWAVTDGDASSRLRPGLHPHDVAQFIVSTALALLLQVVPGSADPVIARRYIENFVLPAIVIDPPPPRRTFPDRGSVS